MGFNHIPTASASVIDPVLAFCSPTPSIFHPDNHHFAPPLSIHHLLHQTTPGHPINIIMSQKWDAAAHEDLLIAVMEALGPPSLADLPSVQEKLNAKGYTFTISALR